MPTPTLNPSTPSWSSTIRQVISTLVLLFAACLIAFAVACFMADSAAGVILGIICLFTGVLFAGIGALGISK